MSPLDEDDRLSMFSSSEDCKMKSHVHSTHTAKFHDPSVAAAVAGRARKEPRSLSDHFQNAPSPSDSKVEASRDPSNSTTPSSSETPLSLQRLDTTPESQATSSRTATAVSSALLPTEQAADDGHTVEMKSLGGAGEMGRNPASCNHMDTDSEAEKEEAKKYARTAAQLRMMRSTSSSSSTSFSSASSLYESFDVEHDPSGVSDNGQHDGQVTPSAQVHREVESRLGNLRDSVAEASRSSLGQTSTDRSSAEDEYFTQVPKASYKKAKKPEQEDARDVNEDAAERFFETRGRLVGDGTRLNGDVRPSGTQSRLRSSANHELLESYVSGLRENSFNSTEQGASSTDTLSHSAYTEKWGPGNNQHVTGFGGGNHGTASKSGSSSDNSPGKRGPSDDHYVTFFGGSRVTASKSGSTSESSPEKRGPDNNHHVPVLEGGRVTESKSTSSTENSAAKHATTGGSDTDPKSHDAARPPADESGLNTERKTKKKRKKKQKKRRKLNADGNPEAEGSHAQAGRSNQSSPEAHNASTA